LDAVEVIRTKRDGGRLDGAQIAWFIDAYVRGDVADEQAAALLMAIFLRGMEPDELTAWTTAMIQSGERLDLSAVARPTVDKHSTGGVGDLVSLVVVPVVASCGAAVPQLAGRGLGHTGGTLDKLEAVPGWRGSLSPEEMRRLLDDVGGVICAAGAGLAPADRKLYALRDITATIESIPLIASSIMSKKLAEGAGALVLDVKVGSGAFMTDVGAARQLAETMVGIGEANGVHTVALLTDMDEPLGRVAGNALEVAESVEILGGGGPPDLVELCRALAREMVRAAGIDADTDAALADGRALATFRRMVAAQGGDLDALPSAGERRIVAAPASGFVQAIDARAVGVAAWRLGAGRARKEDPVSAVAGIRWLAVRGDELVEGQPLFELHVDDPARVPRALEALDGAVAIGPEPPGPRRLLIDRIEGRR
jgi:thymidine phosphorylase